MQQKLDSKNNLEGKFEVKIGNNHINDKLLFEKKFVDCAEEREVCQNVKPFCCNLHSSILMHFCHSVFFDWSYSNFPEFLTNKQALRRFL